MSIHALLRRHSLTKWCDGAQMAKFGQFFASCIFTEPHTTHFRPAFWIHRDWIINSSLARLGCLVILLSPCCEQIGDIWFQAVFSSTSDQEHHPPWCLPKVDARRKLQDAKTLLSVHHRPNLSGYIFATKACIDNFSSTYPHNMVNFGPLTVEIGWQVWGTAAKFNGFHVLASLLHRFHWTEINQTLHDVWPSPGLVGYICIFGGSCTLIEFCRVQNSRSVQVWRSPILAVQRYCTALEQ